MKKKRKCLAVMFVLMTALTAMAHQGCQQQKSSPASLSSPSGGMSQSADLSPQGESMGASFHITYTRADSLKVESLLNAASKLDSTANLMTYFARKLKGIPYVAHTLEVNKNEQLVVNLRQLDCTTYVETVCALTLCTLQRQTTFADYCQWLCRLRYRGGELIDYTSRLHYFTDWIEDNTQLGLVSETQMAEPPFNAVQKVKVGYMTAHPQHYAMLKDNAEFQKVIAEQEKALNGRQYRYIPKADISNTPAMRKAVQDGDIIAIITSKPGLDTSHIGIAVWHKDGLHLLNASQIRKKTVEEPMTLREYMSKHPSQTGIRVVKLRTSPESMKDWQTPRVGGM